MKHLPVSVVIPCYNCGGTIVRAVESVLRQSAPPAEIILVDDGSTDDTGRVLDRLTAVPGMTGMLRILHLASNQGQSVARNAGWDAAGGKYVAFLDADDAWHARKLEIQYEWMAARPSVAVTGHRTVRVRTGIRDGAFEEPLPGKWRSFRLRPLKMLLSNRIHMRSAMVLRGIPYRFDPRMRKGEDYLLWLEMILGGQEAWLLDLPLAFYFKALYGGGGISGDLEEMEAGELDVYLKLYRSGRFPLPALPFFWIFSLSKYAMRRVIKR